MAKNRITFEKQLRESKKKQKAAAKRENRRRQKDEPAELLRSDNNEPEFDPTDSGEPPRDNTQEL